MKTISRRSFLSRATGAAAMLPFAGTRAWANPLGLPLGVQLYSVREQMAQDLDGALAGVAAAGFTEVEAATLPRKTAAEIRKSLDKAGLRCVSAHHSFSDFTTRLDETVAFDKQLGVRFMICPGPGYRQPAPAGATQRSMTLDDWHFNAETFNQVGEKLAGMDMVFGYHNHVHEFMPTEGKIPYEELLRLTDLKKVVFELDCGWAMVAGVKPEELMQRYPHRFAMVHIKDFKLSGTPEFDTHDARVTELGRGTIDYRPMFEAAAKTQHLQHAFVEQEAFDMPWQESLKMDGAYLKNLQV